MKIKVKTRRASVVLEMTPVLPDGTLQPLSIGEIIRLVRGLRDAAEGV